jgi:hypothetical protein
MHRALNIVYRGADGPAEVLLYRDTEPRLELVQTSRAFSFDGDGEAFRIASEAQRIRLAHLFDPYLAVHSSRIEPLPHQITAVYGEMLPRQPLRFLLADDPGAGKTIMAGLFIKELIIRGDLERCLIIARGGRLQKQEQLPTLFDDDEDRDLDEVGGAELEEAEQQIADRATAAQTIPELEAELVVLRDLERLADQLRKSARMPNGASSAKFSTFSEKETDFLPITTKAYLSLSETQSG